MVDCSSIDGVLDHGRLLKGHRLRALWCAVFLPLLFIAVTLGIAITVWIGKMNWDSEVISGLIATNIFGVALFSIFMYLLIKNYRLKKNVIKWLDDSVEVDAFIKRLDLSGLSNIPNQLEISFELRGELIRVKSTSKFISRANNNAFLKYANNNIRLLYSPEYNKVLFPFKCNNTR